MFLLKKIERHRDEEGCKTTIFSLSSISCYIGFFLCILACMVCVVYMEEGDGGRKEERKGAFNE